MEVWEGALLAVGGLWLVGYMSRRNASHPVNGSIGTADGGSGTSAISNLPTIGAGAASGTDTMIAGEPVAPPIMRARPPLRIWPGAGGGRAPVTPTRPIAVHL